MQSIHHVAERVFSSSIWKNRTISRWLKTTIPSLPELSHYPDQIEQVILNIMRNAWKPRIPQAAPLFCAPAPHFRCCCGERYRLCRRLILRTTGRVFRHISWIPCSTRWSAAAKAAPAWVYPLPAILSISITAKLSSAAGQSPYFHFICQSVSKPVEEVICSGKNLGR